MIKVPDKTATLEIQDDEALQKVGRELIMRLGLCFKVSTMYDLNNDALKRPVNGLTEVANRILETWGTCHLNNVGENYYLNTNPVKLDSATFEVSNQLRKILRRMTVNEVSIQGPINPKVSREFLLAFQRSWEAGDPDLFKNGAPKPFAVRTVHATSGTENSLLNVRREVLRRYAIVAMQVEQAAHEVMEGHTSGMSRVRRSVQALADAVAGYEPVLASILALYKSTGVVAHHLVATMAICLLVGRRLGLKNRALSDLCMVAVLHDVGLIELPRPTEAKNDISLWRSRLEQVPDRTGFALCTGSISLGSLNRAATSHEHLIPVRSISGPFAPGEMSRLLAVACAYETLTSPEPPGIDLPADRAMWAVLSGAGTRFEPIACRALAMTMGLYPIGTTIRLDGGQEALVVRQSLNPKFWHRPRVLLLELGQEVDLATSGRKIMGRGQPLSGDVIAEYFIEEKGRKVPAAEEPAEGEAVEPVPDASA